MTDVDLTGMTTHELQELRDEVYAQLRRNEVVETAERRIAEITGEYLNATGVMQGDPWVEPTGYIDTYPVDWSVTHDGKEWVSNYDGNFTEPGVRGWTEIVVDGYPDFVKPVGYEDAYGVGDRVRWTDGLVYESNIDGNTWTPEEAPTRWDLVEE